ncbi:MAG: lipoate-protein ligase A [bacterium]
MHQIKLPPIRLIPYQKFSASQNMAIDEYLLNQGIPALRFYGWKQPTVSFGKAKPNLNSIDLEVCKKNQFDAVVRPTGGKTVLHDLELTYAFIVDGSFFPSSIVESYQIISRALLRSFRELQLPVDMKEEKDILGNTSICFKEVSSFEITIDRKKLVGSAQYRRKGRILQHGSILLQMRWDLWKQLWRLPKDSTELMDRVTCVQDHLDVLPSIQELQDSLSKAFQEEFQTELILQDLTQEELTQIEQLQPKYHWDEYIAKTDH